MSSRHRRSRLGTASFSHTTSMLAPHFNCALHLYLPRSNRQAGALARHRLTGSRCTNWCSRAECTAAELMNCRHLQSLPSASSPPPLALPCFAAMGGPEQMVSAPRRWRQLVVAVPVPRKDGRKARRRPLARGPRPHPRQ